MLSVADAASVAGISKRTMDSRIALGTGPEVTRINRRVLIRDDRLRAWIDEQTGGDAVPPSDEQTDAALTVIRALEHRTRGDGTAMTNALRGTGRQVSLRLCEAVEILHHLVALSGRPDEVVESLRELVRGH